MENINVQFRECFPPRFSSSSRYKRSDLTQARTKTTGVRQCPHEYILVLKRITFAMFMPGVHTTSEFLISILEILLVKRFTVDEGKL